METKWAMTWNLWFIGYVEFRVVARRMETQMKSKMAIDTETGCIWCL